MILLFFLFLSVVFAAAENRESWSQQRVLMVKRCDSLRLTTIISSCMTNVKLLLARSLTAMRI